MKKYKLYFLSVLTSLGLIFNISSGSANTFVQSKVVGDDHFKIYLSTTDPIAMTPPQPEGFQYANGLGWSNVFTNTLAIPLPANSNNGVINEYWINVWVRDEGGGGPTLLGEFLITGIPAFGNPSYGTDGGCRFDNGSTKLLTNSKYWKVTPPLPLSTQTPSPTGYPIWFNNYLPPFVPPTLIPISLGTNGVSPWGLRAGINVSAKWITTNPANSGYTEAWFSTHIRCP